MGRAGNAGKILPHNREFTKTGGAEGIRTPDLLIANETLYQLSYDPKPIVQKLATAAKIASRVPSNAILWGLLRTNSIQCLGCAKPQADLPIGHFRITQINSDQPAGEAPCQSFRDMPDCGHGNPCA